MIGSGRDCKLILQIMNTYGKMYCKAKMGFIILNKMRTVEKIQASAALCGHIIWFLFSQVCVRVKIST